VSDNTTAHKAEEYEAEVQKTIPFHDEILRTAIDVVLAAKAGPVGVKRWLDTGCGPGKLVELARERTRAEFVLADPSEAMLAIAKARHPGLVAYGCASADLPDGESFDAITAVQCHHYGDAVARARAVERCRDRLAPGGVLVVFENVRAETDAGHAIQRKRWMEYQRSRGRDEATIEKFIAREGVAFFPIRVSEHLALFAKLGFDNVEIVWRAYGQAGFFAQRK
jgi:SAM-dependent methyltransferase